MPDAAPPRLDTAPASGPGYAPVSWMAVASVLVSGLFALLLLILAGFAWAKRQPLIEIWLLFPPALGVVLAFTARRQILTSEGTRTGLQLANLGWWLSVLLGFGYVAYLFGLDTAVRNDAEREFTRFTKLVTEIDPADPRDPKLYEACYLTIPRGRRSEVRGPDDRETADKVFRDDLVKLRQMDVVRIVGRNHGAVDFTGFGVKNWEQKPGKITCDLACKMVTPEGEYGLVIPMQAEVDKTSRQWQVVASSSGFVKTKALNRYGWLLERVEDSGRKFAHDFMGTLAVPDQQVRAYEMFVYPAFAGQAAVGGLAAADVVAAREYERALAGPLFALPEGGTPSPTDLERLRACWKGGRIWPPGSVLRDTVDVNPVLRLSESAVELRVPVELNVTGAMGAGAEAARGKIVLRSADPVLAAELLAARTDKGPLTPEPPKGLLAQPIAWRVVRIESDLKAIQAVPPPGQPGGPPG